MASISDKITKTFDGVNPNVARVQAPRVQGVTTIQAENLAGWNEATAVHFSTYRLDSEDNEIPGTQTDWKGIASQSNNTLINIVRVGGVADAGNLAGDVVEMGPTASWSNDMAEALLETHETSGILKNSIVTTTKIADNAVTTAKVADNSITAPKIDFTTLNNNPKFIQTGFFTINVPSSGTGSAPTRVTFPTAFDNIPRVFLTLQTDSANAVSTGLSGVSAANFDALARAHSVSLGNRTCWWLAIDVQALGIMGA